jgi:hypothetical protein
MRPAALVRRALPSSLQHKPEQLQALQNTSSLASTLAEAPAAFMPYQQAYQVPNKPGDISAFTNAACPPPAHLQPAPGSLEGIRLTQKLAQDLKSIPHKAHQNVNWSLAHMQPGRAGQAASALQVPGSLLLGDHQNAQHLSSVMDNRHLMSACRVHNLSPVTSLARTHQAVSTAHNPLPPQPASCEASRQLPESRAQNLQQQLQPAAHSAAFSTGAMAGTHATSQSKLPPSLAPIAATNGYNVTVPMTSESPDNKAAMQAVVDALSVCSTEPAQPPEGALRVKLLPHQSVALGWMLSQESGTRKGKRCSPSGGILADDQVGIPNLSSWSFLSSWCTTCSHGASVWFSTCFEA